MERGCLVIRNQGFGKHGGHCLYHQQQEHEGLELKKEEEEEEEEQQQQQHILHIITNIFTVSIQTSSTSPASQATPLDGFGHRQRLGLGGRHTYHNKKWSKMGRFWSFDNI